MPFFCYLLVLLVIDWRGTAQQCTPSLPAIIRSAGLGGDSPQQFGGLYYLYRHIGLPAVTVNTRIQVTSVAPVVEPWFNQPSVQQWWEVADYPNSTTDACQNHFWTGTVSDGGLASGYEGQSDDDYIMIPTSYSILHNDNQKLVVIYACILARPDGICARPFIYAVTRKNPLQLAASEAEGFDTIITSIFSKYCMTANDIPKQIFTDSKLFCPLIDPPPCIAKAIQGMKNSVVNTTSQSYSTCKWPNSIPSSANFAVAPNGTYYLYRRIFGPEEVPMNQQVLYTQLGSFPSAVINDTATAYWIEYANYDPRAYTCTRAIIVASVVGNGLVTGLIAPSAASGAPQIFTLSTLVLDDNTVLYYGCAYQNLQSGICTAPVAVHLTRKNPLLLTQAEKDTADALENSFFNKYGCSVKDVTLIDYTTAQQACTYAGPDTCMQKYITGYQLMVEGYKSVTSSVTPATTTTAKTY